MVAITADPTRELTIYFRINRDGTLIFDFRDLNGLPFDLSAYSIVVNFKRRKSDSTNFLQVTPTISSNIASLTLTKSQSATFREQTFFWEMVRTKSGLEKNWLTGDAIFHNGKFDGVTNSGQIFINSFDDMVQITITDEVPGTVINKGNYDASTNLFPTPAYNGYQYRIYPNGGVLGGRSVDPGAMIQKLNDGDDQDLANWDIDD